MEALINIQNIVKSFPAGGVWFKKMRIHAVNGVSLQIRKGETLGLVGESGCGKSTLGLLILRLIEPDSGRIFFEGVDITKTSQRKLRPLRREMQIVFQDPFSSLSPRMTAGEIIGEPLLVHKIGSKSERRTKVEELLKLVGLSQDSFWRYPHEFSGGQRQRISIARALALKPKLIIADEPVSSLDVSVRGEIINLLKDIQKEFGLTYLFISHDLTVVEHLSTRTAVMYLGRLMEIVSQVGSAMHPYTKALLSAIPIPDPLVGRKREIIKGDIPSPITLPSGCVFHPRCRYAKEICALAVPPFEKYNDDAWAACHFIHEMHETEEL